MFSTGKRTCASSHRWTIKRCVKSSLYLHIQYPDCSSSKEGNSYHSIHNLNRWSRLRIQRHRVVHFWYTKWRLQCRGRAWQNYSSPRTGKHILVDTVLRLFTSWRDWAGVELDSCKGGRGILLQNEEPKIAVRRYRWANSQAHSYQRRQLVLLGISSSRWTPGPDSDMVKFLNRGKKCGPGRIRKWHFINFLFRSMHMRSLCKKTLWWAYCGWGTARHR